jgi:hypothetical protein
VQLSAKRNVSTFQNLMVFGMSLCAALAVTHESSAGTLSVCQSGCDYSLPSQALGAANDGDTINIGPGTYNDCLNITKNNITVQGSSDMPALTGRVCSQKGIIVTAGQNAVIRNLELYGATDNENYAGIRHDAAGFNLTLDGVYIHDNDDGLLSSSNGDTILIQNSRFFNNGMNASSGYGHNLYIGHANSFIFNNSQSLQAKLGGHEVKTRAANTTIDSSTIAGLAGDESRCIDVAEGGNVSITNSVLQKGPSSENNELIGYGAEGAHGSNSFSMTGNKIIEDRGNGPVVYFFFTPASTDLSQNTLAGPDAVANAGNVANNALYDSRASAGFPAYPALPAAGATTPVAPPAPAPPAPAPVSPSPLDPGVSVSNCSPEGGFCAFYGSMTVRYGANGSYTTGTFTGGVSCSNSVFGDPIPGVYKSCDIVTSGAPAPAAQWSNCANENGFCAFSGAHTVRYGANGVYTSATFTDGVSCSNSVFGDPLPGTYKSCDVQY